MLDDVLFISGYTAEYQRDAFALIDTLNHFKLHHEVMHYDSRGDWVLNTHVKVELCLNAIRSAKTTRIIWLDADARVRKLPMLFRDIEADLALYILRHEGDEQPAPGTLFFRAIPDVEEFFEWWLTALLQTHYPQGTPDHERSDMGVLRKLLPAWKQRIRIAELPPQYCQIFDSMAWAGEPVIEQTQASRRLRKVVNGK